MEINMPIGSIQNKYLGEVLDARSRFFGKKGLIRSRTHNGYLLRFEGVVHDIFFCRTDVRVIEITPEEKEPTCPEKLEPATSTPDSATPVIV